MSLLLLDGSRSTPPRRTGLVRADGKAVKDDTGVFHPLGLTWFPGVYMLKYERAKLLTHLQWFATKQVDYLRSLGEVDWTGREWGPSWPDYVPLLQAYVDLVADHGMRVEWTVVGGRQFDKHTGARRFVPADLARTVADAMRGREHKVIHYECANEWDRLDKVTMDNLVAMGTVLSTQTPNLVALSRPSGVREHAEYLAQAHDDDFDVAVTDAMRAEDKAEPVSGYGAMRIATDQAGATAFTLHPRRSSHDNGWSHVRQGYDFHTFPHVVFNNEPEGPQSSVVPMDDPLLLACSRLLGILCGGAGYVLHVGQGVTGQADPAHGRPEHMWQVPNIDHLLEVVRGVDVLVPDGIENWRCVNNARDAHPLPLAKDGFWEGSDGREGVNKNYAAVHGDEWRVLPIGVRSRPTVGPVHVGTPTRRCHVEAYDPARAYLGREVALVAMADLAAGQSWHLPGRADTMAAYWIEGRYV